VDPLGDPRWSFSGRLEDGVLQDDAEHFLFGGVDFLAVVLDFDVDVVVLLVDLDFGGFALESVVEVDCLGPALDEPDDLGGFGVFEFGCLPGPGAVVGFFADAEEDAWSVVVVLDFEGAGL